MKRMMTIFGVAAVAVAGCGSDDEAVSISNTWARTSADAQTTGAIYMDIEAAEDDTLIAATVPASVAAEAQIHEVVPAESAGDTMEATGDTAGEMSGDMAGESEMSGGMDGMDGAMTMRELEDGLPLPGGETVSLEPGGYHIMLIDIAEPLEVGDEIELTLDFENAESTTITVEVAESAP